MNAPLFVKILEKTLLPFVLEKMPNHRFMQVYQHMLVMYTEPSTSTEHKVVWSVKCQTNNQFENT